MKEILIACCSNDRLYLRSNKSVRMRFVVAVVVVGFQNKTLARVPAPRNLNHESFSPLVSSFFSLFFFLLLIIIFCGYASKHSCLVVVLLISLKFVCSCVLFVFGLFGLCLD